MWIRWSPKSLAALCSGRSLLLGRQGKDLIVWVLERADTSVKTIHTLSMLRFAYLGDKMILCGFYVPYLSFSDPYLRVT